MGRVDDGAAIPTAGSRELLCDHRRVAMIAYMERKESCAQVADLVVPVDDWELGKQSDCGDELIAQADEEREDYLQRLADRCDADDEWAGPWNGDPILIALDVLHG